MTYREIRRRIEIFCWLNAALIVVGAITVGKMYDRIQADKREIAMWIARRESSERALDAAIDKQRECAAGVWTYGRGNALRMKGEYTWDDLFRENLSAARNMRKGSFEFAKLPPPSEGMLVKCWDCVSPVEGSIDPLPCRAIKNGESTRGAMALRTHKDGWQCYWLLSDMELQK